MTNSMTNYIGITIGPVVKIMSMTATPAGLWGTSYLFSYLSKNLCQEILYKGVGEDQFLTPYLKVDDERRIVNPVPGVGLFHDRIIFKQSDLTLDCLQKEVIDKVKENIAIGLDKSLPTEKIQDIKIYIQKVLQIHALSFSCGDEENPLLKGGVLLDAMELQTEFIREEKTNYILKLVENTDVSGHQNTLMKNCFLLEDFKVEEWPLLKKDKKSIQNLDEIALGNNTCIKMKKHQYYAIIQADGDNVGKILSSFKNKDKDKDTMPNQIRAFSKCCFEYCKEAAEKAKTYGAVTIYAGGDDFLAVAPLENNEETVFDFLTTLSEVFNETFNEYRAEKIKTQPSLSIGMTLCSSKFPLYEAFEQSRNLLFGHAKKTSANCSIKNALAFHLQKHSGQSVGLKIKEIDLEDGVYKKIIKILRKYNDNDQAQTILKSMLYCLNQNKALFHFALEAYLSKNEVETNKTLLENTFDNLFDAIPHKEEKFKTYIEDIKVLTMDLCNNMEDLELISDDDNEENQENQKATKVLKALDVILRLMKFYKEPGVEVENA